MKKRSGDVLAGLLLAIGVCTVVSAKNYTEDLAVVTLTSSAPNFIRKDITVEGQIFYEETQKVKLPMDCTVEEIFAQQGAWLEEGAPILRLKESDLQVAYYEICLKEEALEEILEAGGTKGELARWQQVQLRDEKRYLETLIRNEGVVYAEEYAYVIQQDYQEGERVIGASMPELGIAAGGYRLEWAVDVSDWQEFTSGTGVIGTDKLEMLWEEPVFRDGRYRYTMILTDEKTYAQGYPVKISLRYVSDEYAGVIPKSCVRYDKDGAAYVYEVVEQQRVFGKEYVVLRKGITIVDQDGANVAVKAELSNVVLRSSKELTDMQAVAIIEE